MQHVLQISRKIDYALRATIFLASIDPDAVTPFREIARQVGVPEDFLAKILKTLADAGLVRSQRGARGGYQLRKPPGEISFLDVIEAVEGPIKLNVCLDAKGDGEIDHDACKVAHSCSMLQVWRAGQERMLDLYRRTSLRDLAAPRRVKLPVAPADALSEG
jgi:Rrf2 family protein